MILLLTIGLLVALLIPISKQSPLNLLAESRLKQEILSSKI